jgi:hypothetical protein
VDDPAILANALGGVAQLAERNNRTVEARGSIPLTSTRRGRRGGSGHVLTGTPSHASRHRRITIPRRLDAYVMLVR